MKVLVVYYGNKSTFIQRDIDILSKHFDVDEISIRKIRDIFSLIRKIRRNDVIYIWFAGKHAGISVFLAKLFGKKSIIVVGGYDAAKVPEINYGLWAVGSFWDKKLAKFGLKHASAVIPVSKSLVNNLRRYTNLKREVMIIPTGYDYSFWKLENHKKENLVLTVAFVNSDKRIKLKGIDIFLRIAKEFPQTKFRVIGVKKNMQEKLKEYIESENVEILPPLPPSGLILHYQEARVFSLLSLSEGLPNTLCEAMLCGCVPVVSNVGAMPDVVNGYGYVVNSGKKEISNAIKNALKVSPELGEKVRDRIIKLFPMEKREKSLLDLLNNLIPRGERCD